MKTSFLTSRTKKSVAALLTLVAITTLSQPAKALQPVTANVVPTLGFYADNANANNTYLTMSCSITAPTGIYYLLFPVPGSPGSYYRILGTGSNTSPTRSVSFGLVVNIPKTTPDMLGVQMRIDNVTTGKSWWTTAFNFQIKSHFPTVPPPAFDWTGSWKNFVSIGSSSGTDHSYVYTFTKSGASFNMAMKCTPPTASAFKSWTESAVLAASGTSGTHLSGTGTGTYVDNAGRTATYRFNITFDETSSSNASLTKTITSVSKPSGITLPAEIAVKTATITVTKM